MSRQNMKFVFLFLLTLCCTALFAQERTVNGVVVDGKSGEHLPGAIISAKGRPSNVSTKYDGTFSIKLLPTDSVLVVSFIGYKRVQQKVGSEDFITIRLDSTVSADLNDVVVVGYGTQNKRDITGSMATVNLKQIEDMPAASISEMLRGQVPGLNVSGGAQRPGEMATLSIRQQFNWGKDGGNEAPLIVIDDVLQVDPQTGLPTLDRFNQLDLSEVESITVLRDASAAIYGSRASQGVVIVKTKRGQIGAPKVTYSGKFERNDAVSHSKVMNARQYGEYSNSFNKALGRSDDYQYSADELNMMDTLNYDWLGNDWRAANTMQHSLDISGGSDNATYFMGASYYTQGANLGKQDFDRWTYRGGADVKLMSGLHLGATIAASNTNVEKSFTKINFSDGYANGGEQNDYSVLLHMPKYIPWIYNVDGQDVYVSPPLGSNRAGNVKGNNSLSNWNYYALLNNGSKTTNKNFNYNVNFSLAYDVPFIQGLSFKLNYGLSQAATNTEQIMMPQMLYQATTIASAGMHLFSETEDGKFKATNNTANSRVTYDNTTSKSEQSNFFINYTRSFGDHNITAMASVEKSTNELEDRYQIYDNPTAGIYNGTSVSAGTLNDGNTITYKYESGSLSYLGRASYNYKHKYLFDFVFRTDASTVFAPENYWGFFPGVSAGWVISDEPFFKNNIQWMDFLKFRTSWGITGNNNIKAWKWLQVYTAQTDKGFGFGSDGGLYTTGMTPGVTPNRDVHWDRTLQRNFGLDMDFLKNRLSVTFDQYFNSTSDMLTDMSKAINTPISVGGAFAEQNYAAVNAWGSELSITWKDHVGDFSYSIGVNTGLGNYKVTKYYDQAFAYPSESTTRRAMGNYGIVPVWGFKTWKQTSGGDGMLRTDADIDNYWNYLSQNAASSGVDGAAPNFLGITDKSGLKKGMLVYEDVAGDLDANSKTIAGPNGRIEADEDYVKLKKSNRSYGLSTNINLGWKSLSLYMQVATSWGGTRFLDYVKQGTSSTNAMWGQPIYLVDMYDEDTNPNGKYPNIAYYDNFGGSQSDFFMLPTFRMVIRTLSLGYTMPTKLVNKARLKSARFFLSGNNLWDLYNPYPKKFRNMYDAADVGYPTLRTWALGVNIGF
ncbi:TonB-linked outer membrane protein, SusC/RagA family [Arachidicoccus rhizosphaerae]|uniref:TonB-linked outer membrane protein, SusC/RagA family n=1 Tax=Arachidicoccus rhizosphaerae TaxID=551991 RepID=A0A1H3X1C9_9BACT|nr:SusC/RagA family TonB-linked outer membrane protein [Arachidicoccus rhizosphaerae]SDZ93219.1 TonB-linked outer membrane protein, SusC/RagA family [Arachidicoccus rhizosphaerae]